jgi:hypothetical protein
LRAAEQAELASQNEAFGRFKALDYSVSLVSASRGAFGTPTIIAEMVDTDRGLDVLRQEAAIPADAAWVSSRTADIRRLIAGEKPSTTIFASSHNILELHAKLQALRDDAAMIGRMYFREAVSDSERLARGSQSPIPLSYLGRIRDAVQLVNRAAALINILRDELVRSRMPIPQEIKYGVNYVDAQLYQISYEQLQIGNLWFHSWGCGLSGMPELAKERNIDELDFAMSFGRLPNVTYVDGTNEHLSGRIQYPDTTKPYVGAEDCPR